LKELDTVDQWEQWGAWQRTASISSLLATISDALGVKERHRWSDFNPVPMPGEPPKEEKPKQSWQDQKRNIELFNAALGGDDCRKGR